MASMEIPKDPSKRLEEIVNARDITRQWERLGKALAQAAELEEVLSFMENNPQDNFTRGALPILRELIDEANPDVYSEPVIKRATKLIEDFNRYDSHQSV